MTLTNLSIESTLTLADAKSTIPRLGFGIYLSPPAACLQSCLSALSFGYRLIDSAQYYENESEMGQAVRQSGIPRAEVFLTTKILIAGGSAEKSYSQCLESIRKIDGEDGYVDLFLIHSPSGGREAVKEMWSALETLKEEGKIKAIGVSNFGIKHIEEMKEYARVWPPQVNQLDLHPFSQQRAIVSYCTSHSIVVEAYCPLVRNQKSSSPPLVELAKKHKKTTAQILVRYSLQKGWVPLPKSDTQSRIKENADVFGFELDEKDMETLDGLDEGEQGAIVQAVKND